MLLMMKPVPMMKAKQQYSLWSHRYGLDLPFEDELNHEYVQGYCIVDPILRYPRSYTYACNNILDKNTTKMQEFFVWAYKCPKCQNVLPPPLSDQNQSAQMLSYHILFNLKKILTTTNDPLNNSNYFWDWLYSLSYKKLKKLYTQLQQCAEHAGNRYVVEYNAIISYCTGSHNNVGVSHLCSGPTQKTWQPVQYSIPVQRL